MDSPSQSHRCPPRDPRVSQLLQDLHGPAAQFLGGPVLVVTLGVHAAP